MFSLDITANSSQSAVSYASEVTPVALRGYLTTYVNLCWVIGQFIAAGVLLGVQDRTDQWAYKIPFAIQWIWPVPLFILATFAPGKLHTSYIGLSYSCRRIPLVARPLRQAQGGRTRSSPPVSQRRYCGPSQDRCDDGTNQSTRVGKPAWSFLLRLLQGI